MDKPQEEYSELEKVLFDIDLEHWIKAAKDKKEASKSIAYEKALSKLQKHFIPEITFNTKG